MSWSERIDVIMVHIRIFPTSDQEAIDVVNQVKRLYPEAKKESCDGIVEIEITLDYKCKDTSIINQISSIIDDIKLLDFKDKIYFNQI